LQSDGSKLINKAVLSNSVEAADNEKRRNILAEKLGGYGQPLTIPLGNERIKHEGN
jgi:hypothetical protein